MNEPASGLLGTDRTPSAPSSSRSIRLVCIGYLILALSTFFRGYGLLLAAGGFLYITIGAVIATTEIVRRRPRPRWAVLALILAVPPLVGAIGVVNVFLP